MWYKNERRKKFVEFSFRCTTGEVFKLQSCSLQQPRDLLRGNGRVLDNQPVNVLHQHQCVRHPGELRYLFRPAIRRRDYVQRFRRPLWQTDWRRRRRRRRRRWFLVALARRGVPAGLELASGEQRSCDLRIVLGQLEHVPPQVIHQLLYQRRRDVRAEPVSFLNPAHRAFDLQGKNGRSRIQGGHWMALEKS